MNWFQTTSPSHRPRETRMLPLPSALGANQRDVKLRLWEWNYASFPFSAAGHEITEMESSETKGLCGCRVYRSLNRCHNNAQTFHPWEGMGCCLAITEGPAASRQITEPAVLFFYDWWSLRSLYLSCIQLLCNKKNATPVYSLIDDPAPAYRIWGAVKKYPTFLPKSKNNQPIRRLF